MNERREQKVEQHVPVEPKEKRTSIKKAALYLLILFVGGSAIGWLAQAYPTLMATIFTVIIFAACILIGSLYQLPAGRSSPRGAAYKPSRPAIPREVLRAVYARDGGRCVYVFGRRMDVLRPNLVKNYLAPVWSERGRTNA